MKNNFESIRKSLADEAFIQREYTTNHHTYDEESEVYECIRSGDASKIQPLVDLFLSDRLGKLSDNPLMNCRYHFVAGIAVMTRITISCGAEQSACYTLSDLYIQKMDNCEKIVEIQELYRSAVEDFVKESAKVRKDVNYSKAVRKCIDYIYLNLHNSINISELSEYAGITPPYLSALFKKETGWNVSSYIQHKRIETAKDMLKFSDYSCSEIGSYLCFSSTSHFISVFRKLTGTTPSKYRKENCGDTISMRNLRLTDASSSPRRVARRVAASVSPTEHEY